MESPLKEKKNAEVALNRSTSSSSNQLVPDNLDLPDDTFRMSLDNFSVIGENVTIGREISVDGSSLAGNSETPTVELPTPLQTPDVNTPVVQAPDVNTPPPDTPTPDTPADSSSPPILDTPKSAESKTEVRRPQTLLQLSLSKKNDNDVFVKPSPVAELMSPARMLQFEVEASSATPTMKRAAIDFDFFCKNNFEQYFVDSEPKIENEPDDAVDGSTFKETPVIVKADTVRHEIGFGK